MTLDPVTTLTTDDTLDARVRVIDVKASDHKYYGAHDLITVELVDTAGDLPAGLRFAIRRPQDGGTDLRSADRKVKDQDDTPVDENMTKAQLIEVVEKRGVEVPPRATKKALLAALR